jgi:predicted Zn-dependent protease
MPKGCWPRREHFPVPPHQSFSRDFEREADEVGWDYLVSAGIDPRGMIDFFETMKREQEKNRPPAARPISFHSQHSSC